MQQTSRSQLITHTAKRVARILRTVLKGNSRMYLEKISLDLQKGKEFGMQLEC